MKALNLSLMSLYMISLAACGGAKDKVEALASGAGGAQQAPAPASGPALDGKWDSGCIVNPLMFGRDGKRRILIQAEGGQLEHNVITYVDNNCSQPNREQEGARKGSYKFAKDGVVELSVPNNNGTSGLFYFAAAAVGDVLKVGELGSFDSASTDSPAIVLNKQAAEIPQEKISLESGVYSPETATKGVRDIAISTMDANGALAQVSIEILRSTPTKATLNCEADVCTGSDGQTDYVLKIKNAKAFEISMPAYDLTVNYVLR